MADDPDVGCSADLREDGQPSGSVTSTRASLSSRCQATSSGVKVAFSGTTTPPAFQDPEETSMNSGQLRRYSATRSPGATPPASSARANASARAHDSA